jgi:hypothetical protein
MFPRIPPSAAMLGGQGDIFYKSLEDINEVRDNDLAEEQMHKYLKSNSDTICICQS